jgi:hypothetical protein
MTNDISVVFLFADSVPRSGRFGSLLDLSVGDFLLEDIYRQGRRRALGKNLILPDGAFSKAGLSGKASHDQTRVQSRKSTLG